MDRSQQKFEGMLGAAILIFLVSVLSLSAQGQDAQSFFYTDPITGIQYRKEYEWVERPVVRQASEIREVATVKAKVSRQWEMVPETRYVAVERQVWQARWRGVWNPLAPATLQFKPQSEVVWEATKVMTPRPRDLTQWVEHRESYQVPKNYASIHREQIERWVPVRQVQAPRTGQTPSATIQVPASPIGNNAMASPQMAGSRVATATRSEGSLPATILTSGSSTIPSSGQSYPQSTLLR